MLWAGDQVFLDSTDGVTKPEKLQHPAEGPYRVLKNDKRTVTIDRNGGIERVSADRCAFVPPPFDTPPRSRMNPIADGFPQSTEADLSQNLHGDPTDTVDRIINYRMMQNGNLEFLVKWTGYYEPSWTQRTHIPEELASRYRLQVSRSGPSRPRIPRRQRVSA